MLSVDFSEDIIENYNNDARVEQLFLDNFSCFGLVDSFSATTLSVRYNISTSQCNVAYNLTS